MEVRKIAILVSQMDNETAELLLADLSSEQRTAIQDAIANLDAVSDDEADALAAELQQVVAACEVDELYSNEVLTLSHVRPMEPSTRLLRSAGGQASEDHLTTVLRNSSVESLLRVLQSEYPQTLAAVASRLSPSDAASFLAALSNAKRADVMRRIADMDMADRDAMADLSEEISHLLDAELSQVDGSLLGRDAVKAILFAAKGEQRSHLIACLSAGDPRLAMQLGVAAAPGSIETECVETRPADLRYEQIPRDQRQVDKDDWTFERVAALDITALANIVRSADFEIVLLALVGASPAQTDRFLSHLTAIESSRFRRRLSAVGPVRLRDIEFAQRQLTLVAQRAWESGNGQISAPHARGLTLSV